MVLGVLAEVTLIVLLVAVLMVLYVRVAAVGQRKDRTKAPSEDFGLFKQGGAFHGQFARTILYLRYEVHSHGIISRLPCPSY